MTNIIACLDFSDVSESVAHIAANLARAMGARLVLFHSVPIQTAFVAEGAMAAPVQDLGQDTRRADARLVAIEERLRDEGVFVERLLHQGDCVANLLEVLRDTSPELIVMGSHGHGSLRHLLLGCTTQEMIRKGHYPVLVVPSGTEAHAEALTIGADAFI